MATLLRVVLLPLAVLALLDAVSGQRRTLDEASRVTLEKVMKRHPFEAFRAFARGEADETRDLWKKRPADAIAGAVARAALAGLWSKDVEVARGASAVVSEGDLDVEDIERYQQVAFGMLFGAKDGTQNGSLVDYDVFKHTASTKDIAKLLRRRPPFRSEFRFFYLRDLHRSLRPEHLPALCELTQDADPLVRDQASFSICTVTAQTNQHRELVARALLAWPGRIPPTVRYSEDPKIVKRPEPRKYEVSPARDVGFPPLLHAILQRSATEPFRREAPWPTLWQERWAAEATAGPQDRALLQKLLERKRGYMRRIAIRGLGQLRGDALAKTRLAAHAGRTEQPIERALCHLVLARTDPTWRARLQKSAMENDEMLAAALLASPKATIATWADQAFQKDSKPGARAIRLLDVAMMTAQRFAHTLPESARTELVAAAERHSGDLDAARLGMLVKRFPDCRTKTIAAAYLHALHPGHAKDCDFPFLETFDETALRAKLASWLGEDARGAAPGREPALRVLARLVAPEHGAAIAELWTRDPESLFVLARNAKSQAVRGALRKELDEMEVPEGVQHVSSGWAMPLSAWMMTHGLAEPVAIALTHVVAALPVALVREHFPDWRRRALAGATAQLAVRILRHLPTHQILYRGLARGKHPEILAFLRELRKVGGSNVQWVIAELATAGDADARKEMELVFARNYYGWPDDSPGYDLTFGQELDMVDAWIHEIETNCCRRVAASQALEATVGYDAFDVIDDSLRTQRRGAEAWWERYRDRLKWSRLRGRYVVAAK